MVRQVRLKRPSAAVPINAGDMYELNNLADQVLNAVAREMEEEQELAAAPLADPEEVSSSARADEELGLPQTHHAQGQAPDQEGRASTRRSRPTSWASTTGPSCSSTPLTTSP